jgi:hypothetical protein
MTLTRTQALLASTAVQLALFAVPGVTWAQAEPTPPENCTQDPRGVDLVRGSFVYQSDDVVIGPPGFGPHFRVALFGNRRGHPLGRYPHYHRRRLDASGRTLDGHSIGRHRPWETKSGDTRFSDRF